jgi:hypothetical protein
MSLAGATRAPLLRPASTARLAPACCCAAILLMLLAGSAHAAAEAAAAAPPQGRPAAQKPVPATAAAKKPAPAAPTQAAATAHGSKGSKSSGGGSQKRVHARRPSWLARAPADKMAHVVLPGGASNAAPCCVLCCVLWCRRAGEVCTVALHRGTNIIGLCGINQPTRALRLFLLLQALRPTSPSLGRCLCPRPSAALRLTSTAATSSRAAAARRIRKSRAARSSSRPSSSSRAKAPPPSQPPLCPHASSSRCGAVCVVCVRGGGLSRCP